jgi:hypothetical protein
MHNKLVCRPVNTACRDEPPPPVLNVREFVKYRTQDGDPANEGVGAAVAGDAAVASRKVSLCFFWPLSSGQSL